MLRIIQNSSSASARTYYTAADYYVEGYQELPGIWHGKGAARLGLDGMVAKEAWSDLCDNRDPNTGRTLTARRKKERRVGYDFNFHAPKSLSLLYGMTHDESILEAFRDCVNDTMRDIEAEIKTRVRKGGKDSDRTTGNVIYGEFTHFTARPIDGVPDPHLHSHCFVFNSTWDDKENRWKAGEFKNIKRDGSYFEAMFHSRLARRLEELGVPVRRTKKGWELDGIAESALKKFSRRTALIEKEAKEKGITDPEAKAALGAKTRERKAKNLTLSELRDEWRSRLSGDEFESLGKVAYQIGSPAIAEDFAAAQEAVTQAVDHWLERNSVVPERKALATALRRSAGAVSIERVEEAFHRLGLIDGVRDDQRLITTREVLQEEQRMIDFARNGRGVCRRLGSKDHSFERQWLNEGQRRAAQHILSSTDRVIVIRGAAGVGKTSMMQEAIEAMEANGQKVYTFAPSADASRGVLRSEGFANADTVARLLADPALQSEVRGSVIWIDEAGLVSTRTMAQVFDLARKLDSRVILSGDRFQHGSVERGAALRLLEEEAGVRPAEIKEIQRQKGDYKHAVKMLSEGRAEAGFRQLEKLGWIKEVPYEARYATLASDYVEATIGGKSALVISPTHLEGEWTTDEIRARLQRLGRIGKDEHEFQTLSNANLTEAERKDGINFLPGDMLVFHQNAKGHSKGERVTVGDKPLPLGEAAKFQLFRPNMLKLAAGDVIRVTRNGTTFDGEHRLNNGGTFTVKDFDRKGNIVLTNGWTIDKGFGFLAYGYVATSHSSQGKTVDHVLIAQSSASYPASSREQFYVSISRGKSGATVYTDDKRALLDAVNRSDERLTATEFVGGRQIRDRITRMQRENDALSALTIAASMNQRQKEELVHER